MAATEASIRFYTSFHNVILDVMSSFDGWEFVEDFAIDGDWDVVWGNLQLVCGHILPQGRLREGQVVNHFQNCGELTRKDLLIKNLKKTRRALEKEGKSEEASAYDIVPTSFLLPSDYSLFVEYYKTDPNSVWIMKPIGRAQGRGIFLFQKLSDINKWRKDHRWKAEHDQPEAYIVQRYIEDPYLIGGKKFDLRLYVVVTSFSPLKVWLYRGGFARFSSHRFSMKPEDIENQFIHLTNVAIQKKAEDYKAEEGVKWSISSLKMLLMSKHGGDTVNTAMLAIEDVVMRTLLSVQGSMVIDKSCFELYGYDVILDANLKPWILEVNSSPSMSAENKEDYTNKRAMMMDMWSVVDPERRRQGDEDVIGGFDLIWDGKRYWKGGDAPRRSFLGSKIENVVQRKQNSDAL